MDKVKAHKDENKSVVGYPGSCSITNEELVELDYDVLIPFALENVITEKNAGRIQAKIVAEAANGPTTPAADNILNEKGVFMISDILANAGGVTVSYFEWVRDLQAHFWTLDDVRAKLEGVMVDSFDKVLSEAKEYDVDMRLAAYIVGVSRVAEAMSIRGLYP